MPLDARTSEALAWLAKADQDLGAARMLLDGYPDVTLFHCQQARRFLRSWPLPNAPWPS